MKRPSQWPRHPKERLEISWEQATIWQPILHKFEGMPLQIKFDLLFLIFRLVIWGGVEVAHHNCITSNLQSLTTIMGCVKFTVW